MRSSNPALSDSLFRDLTFTEDSTTMSVNGTAVKTLIALVLLLATAGFTWMRFKDGQSVQPFLIGGLIVGAIAAIATIFKPNWAPVTTPVYALAEGCFLGGISALIQSRYPDDPIVFQACCLTIGTLFLMLIGYQTGVIRVTEKLRAGIMAATGAVCLVYIVSMVANMFGGQIPYIHGSGAIGIGFSVVVVGIAAFNLVLDFDLIDRLVAQRAPKQMEWYGAFALMVTLVWLYIEILRLLSKLQDRR